MFVGKHHWKFDFGGFDLMGTFLIKKMELLVVEVTSINLNTMKDELLMQTLNLVMNLSTCSTRKMLAFIRRLFSFCFLFYCSSAYLVVPSFKMTLNWYLRTVYFLFVDNDSQLHP